MNTTTGTQEETYLSSIDILNFFKDVSRSPFTTEPEREFDLDSPEHAVGIVDENESYFGLNTIFDSTAQMISKSTLYRSEPDSDQNSFLDYSRTARDNGFIMNNPEELNEGNSSFQTKIGNFQVVPGNWLNDEPEGTAAGSSETTEKKNSNASLKDLQLAENPERDSTPKKFLLLGSQEKFLTGVKKLNKQI